MNSLHNLDIIIENPESQLENLIECDVIYNMKYVCDNHRTWKSIIRGKGTYQYKDIIKANKYVWNKYEKNWFKILKPHEITEKMIKEQNKKEEKYYNEKGLTYPYCYLKCVKNDCNQRKMEYNEKGLCQTCNFEECCVGGLKCSGWMGVPCKYNELTMVGSLCCENCDVDSLKWVKAGEINGRGGWFANDNS